jgi:hypothetical protein
MYNAQSNAEKNTVDKNLKSADQSHLAFLNGSGSNSLLANTLSTPISKIEI